MLLRGLHVILMMCLRSHIGALVDARTEEAKPNPAPDISIRP
jgi:hypothetical protein